MRQLGRAAIDLKADLFLLQNKSDDAAALGESWNVAYRERTKALGRSQNGRELVFLRRTDKQNAAGRRILHFLDPPYRQLPPIDALAFHGRVQNRPKRILSENAYEQVGANNARAREITLDSKYWAPMRRADSRRISDRAVVTVST